LWGLWLILGVTAGVVIGSSQQAVRGLVAQERWNWAETAAYVVVWAVLGPPAIWAAWTAADRSVRQQSGATPVGPSRRRFVAPAMRSGSLPADAEPELWRRVLTAEVRQWNGSQWLAAVYAAVVAVLIGLAAAIANDNNWGVWALALIVAAVGLVAFRWSRRQLRIARRLQAELPADRSARP
jgi:drug/metabolite transporter (DMT)-like permease